MYYIVNKFTRTHRTHTGQERSFFWYSSLASEMWSTESTKIKYPWQSLIEQYMSNISSINIFHICIIIQYKKWQSHVKGRNLILIKCNNIYDCFPWITMLSIRNTNTKNEVTPHLKLYNYFKLHLRMNLDEFSPNVKQKFQSLKI